MISLKAAKTWILLALTAYMPLAHSTESELRQDLLRLEQKLVTDSVSDNGSNGAQAARVKQLFARAEDSYRSQKYMDVVKTLNQVLNISPSFENYLDAQYYLGRSYEELSYPARSIKAYLRYLGSFASKSGWNHPRFLEVIQRLLLQKKTMLVEEGETLDRLLISLINLNNLPAAKRDQVKLLASKSAYQTGKFAMADEWLNDLIKKSPDATLVADAQFYLALLKLKSGQYDKSEELFLKIADSDVKEHFLVSQLARLNLARIYAARNLPKLSFTWYQKVQGPGESQRLALYESTGLLMQSKDFERAKGQAELYLKHYPKSREASLIRERLAFLQLNSGSFEAAETNLGKRDGELTNLSEIIAKDYEGKFVLKEAEIEALRQKAAAMNIESIVLERASALNQRLKKAKTTLEQNRQEIRSLAYTLGRISDSDLRPELLAKDEQYWNSIEELSALGENLIAHELTFYNWSAAEQYSFVKAKERRKKILDDQTPRPVLWENTYRLSQLESRAAKLDRHLASERAKLSGAIFAAENGTAEQIDKASQAKDRLTEIQHIKNRLQLAMEDQRALWVANYKNGSPLLKTRKHFLLLTQEFLDTNEALEQKRDQYPDPATKHVQEDFASNWELWPRIAGKILVQMNKTEQKEQAWLDAQQIALKTSREVGENLALREEQLRHGIAKATGKAFPSVAAHIRYAINEQAARGKKWMADVEWQRYLRETAERSRLQAKQDLDETTIKEKIRDTEIERALHE
ncbi:MAG: hypothetical protein EOP10_07350 [Proteobacteria bacterium]|nr:MAG: hypothetical protein EOP10_07350 [Pseudomonadota bacterium]